MVQVDVFWSYALGASMACAAHRQLEKIEKVSESSFFVKNMLYLSTLFAPSGIYLLWQFTGWETMFVFDKTIPAWLVTLFAITNVTQGILGFFVCYWLIRRGRIYEANLQWVFGYLLMFFILVHGWDGTGYSRFFYSGTIEQWRAGTDFHIYQFFYSDVALTLYAMGLIILPPLFLALTRWTQTGYQMAGVDVVKAGNPTAADITMRILSVIFGLVLSSVIVASILIHVTSWLVGVPLFFFLFYAIMLKRGGLIHRQIAALTLDVRV